MSASAHSSASGDSLRPSVIADPARYRRWRAHKLARARRCLAQPPVEISDPAHLTAGELAALRERMAALNFALYRMSGIGGGAVTHQLLKRLCRQLGLARLAANPFSAASGISEIQAAVGAERNYIPYTTRALNWHTDGYYHPPTERINAFALHTVRAAADGGENQLLDHELVYLLLRERDPALAACLFAGDVLTIPPGIAAGGAPRPASTGPVFAFTADRLQMRFTLRRRHINWKPTAEVRAARDAITALLTDPANPFILTRQLRPGEGIISNNTPHNRAAFAPPTDGSPGRLVLRARFYDWVGGGE